MVKSVIFLPEALEDARLAYAWYEEKENGLGEDFYRALSVALTYVARNPDIPRLIFKSHRRVLLRRLASVSPHLYGLS